MSHEISKVDRQQGIEMAWHKLTEVMANGIDLATCWLAQWDIRSTPMFTLANQDAFDASPETVKAELVKSDSCQLVATDDARIKIGKPVDCDTYAPITNRAFLDIVSEALLSIADAKVASVGSVCERGRVFVSVKLKQEAEFEAAGREFKPYLNFLNSHDQSTAFLVNTSNICTVCNNTFGMNLAILDGQLSGLAAARAAKSVRIKLKHTKHVAQRLENVPEIIDGFLGAQAKFRAIMDNFAKTEIAPREVKPLFTGLLFGKLPDVSGMTTRETIKALELSTRKVNQIDALTTLFHSGKGNRGRDLSDVFSAVTDYYTHESSGNVDRAKQFVSSEFGSGQAAKERAFSLLQNPDEVKGLVQNGNAVLAMN